VEAARPLRRLERIVDRSGVAERIEALLPAGARPRQLSVRTLLVGILLVAADGRPLHLTRVHAALTALPAQDQRRLGVIAQWRSGDHLLSYRQTERTCALVARALAPSSVDYMIAGHLSAEPGARVALEKLGLEPLLDLNMRLGEGTGGLLAVPLVQAAARALGEMATLKEAGI
jgi:hypothetical protein